MNYLTLLTVLILTGPVQASDNLTQDLKQLDNEDFEIREDASYKLSFYPPAYAKTFLLMFRNEDLSLGVRHRLRWVAYKIFKHQIIPSKLTYKKIMAQIGFDWTWEHNQKGLVGIKVDGTHDDFDAAKKLQQHDVITAVNGGAVATWDRTWCEAVPGQKMSLTIRRYLNQAAIRERGYIEDSDKHKEINVQIIIGTKDYLSDADLNRIQELIKISWKEFYISTLEAK